MIGACLVNDLGSADMLAGKGQSVESGEVGSEEMKGVEVVGQVDVGWVIVGAMKDDVGVIGSETMHG